MTPKQKRIIELLNKAGWTTLGLFVVCFLLFADNETAMNLMRASCAAFIILVTIANVMPKKKKEGQR